MISVNEEVTEKKDRFQFISERKPKFIINPFDEISVFFSKLNLALAKQVFCSLTYTWQERGGKAKFPLRESIA